MLMNSRISFYGLTLKHRSYNQLNSYDENYREGNPHNYLMQMMGAQRELTLFTLGQNYFDLAKRFSYLFQLPLYPFLLIYFYNEFEIFKSKKV